MPFRYETREQTNRQTDGRTDGRLRPVMPPIKTAAAQQLLLSAIAADAIYSDYSYTFHRIVVCHLSSVWRIVFRRKSLILGRKGDCCQTLQPKHANANCCCLSPGEYKLAIPPFAKLRWSLCCSGGQNDFERNPTAPPGTDTFYFKAYTTRK